MVGLDIYRICAVLVIFLFHSNMHLGCYYGILDSFVGMGAIYMTAFFILSGYALYLTYESSDLTKIENIKKFYVKRLIGILPLYYSVALLYIIFLGSESLKMNIILAPIEILGLQSTFSSIFGISHNIGTWFVSCIVLCYLVYPLIQEITKQISIRTKWIIISICAMILLWSPFIVYYFKTSSIYANPFFRALEFLIGSLLCSMKSTLESIKKLKWLFCRWTVCIEFLLLVIGVTIAVNLNIAVGNYMLYSWIALPVFSLLIISMSGMHIPFLNGSCLLKYLCDISYAFFFAQFFTWKTTIYMLSVLRVDGNLVRIILSFSICLIYSILLHEIIEKPISKVLKNVMK